VTARLRSVTTTLRPVVQGAQTARLRKVFTRNLHRSVHRYDSSVGVGIIIQPTIGVHSVPVRIGIRVEVERIQIHRFVIHHVQKFLVRGKSTSIVREQFSQQIVNRIVVHLIIHKYFIKTLIIIQV